MPVPIESIHLEEPTLVQGGLRNVGCKGLGNRIAQLAATVDDHFNDEAEVCHFLRI